MKFLALAEQLNTLPDGVPMEKRTLRNTVVFALATSILVPMTGTALNPSERDRYFFENAEAVRKCLFGANEVVPFNVDRALTTACNIWRKRYLLAYAPTPMELLSGFGGIEEYVPEIPGCQVSAADVNAVVSALRECLGA